MADSFVTFVSIQPSAAVQKGTNNHGTGSSPVKSTAPTVKHGTYGGKRKNPVIK